MNDLMIDIETLGKAPGSVILSIGAVWFDAATGVFGDEFYVAINPQSATNSGLRIDVSTVQWWMKQSEDARSAAFSGERFLSGALGEFGDFVRKSEAKRIWAKPPSFDLVLLEAAFAACSIPIPWEYWTPRDCRTLFEISSVKQIAVGTAHNALDDAKAQATAVIEAYRVLGLSDQSPIQAVEPTGALVERCDICAKPLNPDDICATDIELGICHAECLEGSPVVNLDTGEPLPDSELHTYRFGDTDPALPAKKKREWQPIATAPTTGEFIARCGAGFPAFSCFWNGTAFVHYDDEDGLINYPATEWMPFPPAEVEIFIFPAPEGSTDER